MKEGQLRAVRLAVVPAGIALGLVAEWTTLHRPSYAVAATAQEQQLAAGDFAVGVALLVCGAVCRWQRPKSRVGLLLVATGLAWFLGTFAGASFASVAAVGALLVALHRGPARARRALVSRRPALRPGRVGARRGGLRRLGGRRRRPERRRPDRARRLAGGRGGAGVRELARAGAPRRGCRHSPPRSHSPRCSPRAVPQRWSARAPAPTAPCSGPTTR